MLEGCSNVSHDSIHLPPAADLTNHVAARREQDFLMISSYAGVAANIQSDPPIHHTLILCFQGGDTNARISGTQARALEDNIRCQPARNLI